MTQTLASGAASATTTMLGGHLSQRIRHTKIVATIGPASSSPAVLRALVSAGLNVARLNFSHGEHADHAAVVRTLRELARELRRPMAIIADLQGPKIRIGKLPAEKTLVNGSTVFLVTRDLPDVADVPDDVLPVPLEQLSTVLEKGAQVLLVDGAIRLVVKDIDPVTGRIECVVIDGGPISSHKGLNLPDHDLGIPSLTEKDIVDLRFAVEQEVDYVAQSFVQSPDDVHQLRTLIAEYAPGTHRPQIISKIEKRLAVERLDDILAASDAVMVARGDLGVELGAEGVPLLQKRIIKRANELGIPAITATQMLESMIQNSEPTRAEASDVANAVLDGTSAVMLSAETAVGAHPVEAIQVLDRIARTVEPALPLPGSYLEHNRTSSIPKALSDTSCELAEALDAAAIVVLTETGRSARHVSRNRPRRPVIACSASVHACRRMALDWGTVPVLIRDVPAADITWGHSNAAVRLSGVVEPGERVVYIAGTIAHQPGMTNMLKVEEFADTTDYSDLDDSGQG